MLVLHNVRIVPSNMRKNKGTTECDKSTVTCDVGTLHNVRILPQNVKKKKGTIEFDKCTITCDVSITQCEDGTIK